MKTCITNIQILAVIIAAFVLNACDIGKIQDSVDDFTVVVELQEISTYGSIQVLDAATGELITGNLSVSFIDEENLIIDAYSKSLSEVVVSNGFVNFGIKNEFGPTEDQPVSVGVLVERDGYIEQSATIVFTAEGSTTFSISMVNEQNLPDGMDVAALPAGAASAGGMMLEDISIGNDTKTGSTSSSGLNISAGTVLKDETGAPLTGSLTAHVTSYDTSTLDGAGGILDEEVMREAGEGEQSVLGLTEMFLSDDSGRPLTAFEPATLKDGSSAAPVITFSINKDSIPENTTAESFRFRYRVIDDNRIFTQNYNAQNWFILPDQGDDFVRVNVALTGFTSFPIVYWMEARQFEPINAQLNITNPYDVPVSIRSFAGGWLSRSITTVGAGETLSYDFPVSYTYTYSVIRWRYYRCGWFRWCRQPDFRRVTRTQTVQAYARPTNLFFRSYPSYQGFNFQHNFLTDGLTANVELPFNANMIFNASLQMQIGCANPSEGIRITSIPTANVFYRRVGSTAWLNAHGIEWDYQDLGLRGAKVNLPIVESGQDYEFRLLYDVQDVQSGESLSFTQANPVVGTTLTLTPSQSSSICN